MFSTGRVCRASCAALTLTWSAVVGAQTAPPTSSTAPVGAQTASSAALGRGGNDATLYRVFLRDGSALVSYGEYARVADRVVITLPIGGGNGASPELQLLTIPADTVDWDKTDAYADSARAARYAATSGPNDFALLNQAVSIALSDVANTADRSKKIAMATEARQSVMRWAAEHYGYRGQDVATLASMFDEAIADARRAGGEKNVELSMVAGLAAPPGTPLLPPPSLHEGVEQALRAVTLAPDARQRVSLLQAIERTLAASAGAEVWATELRRRATDALALERRTDRAYAALTRHALRSAERYAAAANVTAVERTIRAVLRDDDRLGQRRPEEIASLLATLDGQLDAARRLRLARDNREARAGVLLRYRRAVARPLAIMRRARPALDEIRRLAGPPRARVTALATQMQSAARILAKIEAPEEFTAAHGLLQNAARLASRASEGRQRAIMTGSMQSAWDASSAAAGAIMLFDRAVEELKTRQPGG